MDETTDHGTESDVADEPSHDEQDDDDVEQVVHGVPVLMIMDSLHARSLSFRGSCTNVQGRTQEWGNFAPTGESLFAQDRETCPSFIPGVGAAAQEQIGTGITITGTSPLTVEVATSVLSNFINAEQRSDPSERCTCWQYGSYFTSTTMYLLRRQNADGSLISK